MYFGKSLSLMFAFTLLASGCKPSDPAVVADSIYVGGSIVTISDAQPNAEALAVKDGKILAVGARAEIEKSHRGDATVMTDLAGKTLIPGFIDGHAHGQQFGTQAVGANLLAPPDGEVNTVDDVVAKLKTFAAGTDVEKTGWIFGIGYDDSLLGRHPTRQDLDKVSTTVPVLATHISGHFMAVNTLGLKIIGFDASTKDPEGGVIRRETDGKTPNGVLEELAAMPYMVKFLTPVNQAGKDDFLKRGMEMAKSFGYTTVNEGRMFGSMSADMEDAAKRGLLDIDFTGWMDYSNKAELDRNFSKEYKNHYRLAGLKITLDGSPQGRTAWRTQAYLRPPEGQKPGYKGYPAIPNSTQVAAYVEEAYAKGWLVKLHANGDAAIDQMLDAVRQATAKHGVKPGQAILVHGQYIRADQIAELKKLGIFPSMFPMHTFYWGDWYKQIVDPETADNISPMRSILDAGMHATSHTDAPVALPNLMQVAWATVNRTSRSGTVIGAKERVTPLEAMKMITLWGAEQFGEQDSKGSLEAGKRADMVVLSDNPLTIDPMKINSIVVLETIKDGKSVYKRGR